MTQKHKVAWVERKNDDWFLLSLESGEKDVSVNRKSKKGEIFPNFDEIMPGMEIEGELWTSPAGKHYLFPPREANKEAKTGQGGAYKAKLIEDAQNRKATQITQFQATKEESIKLMSAQRDAVLLTQTLFGDTLSKDPILSEDDKRSILKKEVIRWRDWLLSDEFTEVLPFSKDGAN